MTGRTLQDIENSFDGASMNEDLGQLSLLAKDLAKVIARGIHSGSPMYREFFEPVKAAFVEGLDAEFAEYLGSDSLDEQDPAAELAAQELEDLSDDRQSMVDYIKENLGEYPGEAFFGTAEDIQEFNGLWTAGQYDQALDILDGLEDISVSNLDELKDFLG